MILEETFAAAAAVRSTLYRHRPATPQISDITQSSRGAWFFAGAGSQSKYDLRRDRGGTEYQMTASLEDDVAELRRANAELRQRLDEALAREAATAKVLGVINSSPGDLTPVFDAMLQKAHTLSGAAHGVMMIRDGETFRTVAVNGLERAFVDAVRQLDTMRPPE